ncbi:hypothetical protein AMAG_07647 [Allomyces macrogynus ATCC 38327]|uniref:VPS9 domain-containing protein n=1 Tax=Allomyces macrogynus (strain ATCC 38327) TaxID=578462 RepID=A0A0L0SIU7_ALLM3|nr:hypothetical protein AMAG_07647 [Allomyces macrogynus ATCC 38327]|eukprot:KNE62428.1 hypothetical protein AMAG_07647 [Allomyces macrogynus ATCC 38327]
MLAPEPTPVGSDTLHPTAIVAVTPALLATSPLLDLGHLIGRVVPPEDIPPATRRLGLALATPLGRKSPLAASAPGLATLTPDPSRAGDGLLVPRPVTALPALTLGLGGSSARSRSCAADLNGDAGRTDADADRDDEAVTTIRFVNGSTYRGALHEGEMHGSSGMYEWAPSGTVYLGEFARNRIEGRGRFMWRDGSEYEGDVSNNLRCGNGRIRLASGVVYEGEWVMSMPHGKGKMTYSESPPSFYEGSFLFGQRHGSGQMHYPSGAVYTGQWHEGVRHGRGTMVWPDLSQEYDGEWYHGLMHGRGIYLWHRVRQPGESPGEQYYHASNWYEGDFVDNQRHGKGAFQYADGSIYVGDFAGNQKHGNALFRDRYGRIHEGEWHRDQMVAPLALYEGVPVYQFPYPDGTEIGSIFRRHQAQLAHVYAKYATAPHLDDPKFKCGMTFDQLYLLLMDIGLRAHRMSLTRVGDLAESVLRMTGAQQVRSAQTAICDTSRPRTLHYFDFLCTLTEIAQALYAPASPFMPARAQSGAMGGAGVDAKTADKLQVQVMIEGSVRAVVLDNFLTTDVAVLESKRPRSASARVVSLPPPAAGHDDDDAVATLMHVRARQPWLARPRVQHAEFMSLLGTFRAPVAALHAHRPHWHVGHVLQLLTVVDLVAVDDVGRLVHVLAGCIPWLTADAGIYLEYPLVAIELFEVLFEVFASSRPGADALSAPARPRPPTVPGFLPGSAPSPRNAFRPAAHLSRGTSAAAGTGTASAGAGDARKPGSSGHRAVAIAHAPSGHAGHDVLGASASTASATTDDNAATIAPAAAGTHSAGTASRAASTSATSGSPRKPATGSAANARRPSAKLAVGDHDMAHAPAAARSARRLSAAKSEMLLAASSAASVAHDTSVRSVQDSGAAIAALNGRLGSHESSVGGSGRRLRSGASASFDNVAVTTVTWVKERVGGPTGSGAVAGKIAEADELTGKLSTAAASGAATPGAEATAVSLEEHVRARFMALFAKDEQLRWIARTLGD